MSSPSALAGNDRQRPRSPVLGGDAGEAWDLGQGLLSLHFKTKLNSLDPAVVALLHQVVSRAERDFGALLIDNRGTDFCMGANLVLVTKWSARKQWEEIQDLVSSFQVATQRIRYARVPVLVAPFGRTWGGGLELCLPAAQVEAHAQTSAGLVETDIGLLPGGGGTLNLLGRTLDGLDWGAEAQARMQVVFDNITGAVVSRDAAHARALGYLRPEDGIWAERRDQQTALEQRALALAAAGYRPPRARTLHLPGAGHRDRLCEGVRERARRGLASAHDRTIAEKLAAIYCGAGPASEQVTEQEMLTREREAFVSLCGEPRSQARMQHLLINGAPLRN